MWIERLLSLRRVGSSSPRARRILFGLTTVFFVAVVVLSVRALPEIEGGLRWDAVALIAVPTYLVVLALMAMQYVVSARIGGLHVGFRAAAPVAVLSTAANFLPIPGAVLMRAGAMQREGVSAGRALGSAALVGLSRLGGAGVLAAATLALAGRWTAATVAIGVGAAGTAAYALGVWRLAQIDRTRILMLGLAVGLAMAAVSSIALWLATVAMRSAVDPAQATAISSSGALADAVGVLPGGLGLRESLAAGIAATTGTAAAVGSVATLIVRFVSTVMLAVSAGAIAVTRQEAAA